MSDIHSAFRRCSTIARKGRLGRLLGAPVRFPRSLLRRRQSDIHGPQSHNTDLFWGESMEVLYPEMVSVHVDRYGFFEEGLTAYVLENLKPGMTVCDIGGHYGYFSRLAEFLVRGGGSVHAFEPTPSTFEILQRNTRRFSAIHLNQMAVANVPGTLELTDFGTAYAAFNTIATCDMETEMAALGLQPTKTQVKTTTVDAYAEEHRLQLDFVKIDAEGAEPLILKGMEKTLQTSRPVISMEVGDWSNRQSSECVQTLVGFGYKINRYDTESRSFKSVSAGHNYSHDNLFFVHDQKSAA